MRIFTKKILLFLSLLSVVCSVSFASPLTDKMKSSIEDRLNDALQSNNDDIYMIFSPVDGQIWNENAWTHNLDLTGVAWWNSADGGYRRATLITPRHLLVATHYSLSVGNEVMFLDKENNIVRRKITTKKTLLLPENIHAGDLKTVDIDILELASDVPSNITYYPLFSIEDLANRIDDTFPVISFNQDNAPGILPITYLGDYGNTSLRNTYKGELKSNGNYADFTQTESPFRDFRQADLRKGDSSNPIFALIDNQLVLFSHQSRTASSTNFSWFIPTINAALDEMESPYHVTVMDISRFATLDGEIIPRLNSAPETSDNYLVQKNTNKTLATAKNTCSLSAEYLACQSKQNNFAGAKKTLSCIGILPQKYTGYSQTLVNRTKTLDMALKMLGKDLVTPSKDIAVYRDVKNDLSLLQMTQTGIKYGILSETNKYFMPNRNTTRAEAYHMFAQSVCMPVEKIYPEWEKNLHLAASQYHLTTQPWEKFEADRYLTNGELLIIAKRVLEYKYTYGGCEVEKKKKCQ